jgi:hypothetical protein
VLTLPLPMIRMGPSDDRSNQAHNVAGAGRFDDRRFAAFAPSAPRLAMRHRHGDTGVPDKLARRRATARQQSHPLCLSSPVKCRRAGLIQHLSSAQELIKGVSHFEGGSPLPFPRISSSPRAVRRLHGYST